MSLSKRLKMVADMVRCGSLVADIGTDHGYLPAHLTRSGKCPGGIAADLRKGPLENAKETLHIYGVEDKVQLRLSDGLDSVLPHECDDIVFAGMGGTLIAELLSRTEWVKDKEKRIIAQPMTHSEDVRKFFVTNGFKIITENACYDDRNYVAICAEYTGENEEKDDLYHHIGIHPIKGNEASLNYAKKQILRIKKRAEALQSAGVQSPEKDNLFAILKQFEEEQLWQE
ncbi:MAG: SAM-dependent methyltransferase [Clostridia bacterium]|nr:SAM-dependent methyltransferase [Clostridia bacterium]